MDQWHAMAEYRWLGVKDGSDKNGWLVGVDRDVTKNLRLGVGYNFTELKGNHDPHGRLPQPLLVHQPRRVLLSMRPPDAVGRCGSHDA